MFSDRMDVEASLEDGECSSSDDRDYLHDLSDIFITYAISNYHYLKIVFLEKKGIRSPLSQ